MSSHDSYFDPFSVQEEEEYLELERKESHQQIQKWIHALCLSFTCPSHSTESATSILNPNHHGDDKHNDNEHRVDLVIPTGSHTILPPRLPVLHPPWYSNTSVNVSAIMEIQLNLPLELQSLQDLVYAMQQPPQLLQQQPYNRSSSSSAATTTRRHCCRQFRLKLSHWGLPADQGIATLIPLLPQIVELSLTHCGITAQGFHQLLQNVCHNSNDNCINLQSLNLSHNPLLRMEGNPTKQESQAHHDGHDETKSMKIPFQSPKELLQHLLLHILPSCTILDDSLKHLNLSSTGLCPSSHDLWDALWQGVQQSRLDSLDVSNNNNGTGHSDTILLFQSILPYLSTLPLRSLVLTRTIPTGPVMTTPNNSPNTNLMDQVHKRLDSNHSLLHFGPFSMLGTKTNCPQGILDDIHHYFLRRNRLRHYFCYLSTTTIHTTSPTTTTPTAIGKYNAFTTANTTTNFTSDTTGALTTRSIPSNLEFGAMSVLIENLIVMRAHRHSYSLVYWIFQETSILRERNNCRVFKESDMLKQQPHTASVFILHAKQI